jgi:hypothetical protein
MYVRHQFFYQYVITKNVVILERWRQIKIDIEDLQRKKN